MGLKDIQPYQFKPGQSGNPSGQRKGAKTFRRASADALNRIVDAFLYGGPDALQELYESRDVNDVEKFCIHVIKRASEKGDPIALNIILDRFIGKIPDPHKLIIAKPDGEDAAAKVNAMSAEELEKRREALMNARK